MRVLIQNSKNTIAKLIRCSSIHRQSVRTGKCCGARTQRWRHLFESLISHLIAYMGSIYCIRSISSEIFEIGQKLAISLVVTLLM